jgi:choline dehydrogenase-like flavoprotein
MLIDASALPLDEELETDVCIVGAGPAGISIALELLATGARICIIESGGRDPQNPPGGESVGRPYFALETAGVHAFGGSLPLWGEGEHYWHAVPLDRIDFESRPGIPYSGWPFDRTRLEPFYARAAALSGIGSAGGTAGEDVDLATSVPVTPNRLLLGGIRVAYDPFARYFDRLAAADTVSLILNARVAELLTDEDRCSVNRIKAFSQPARPFFVRPRLIVLAAGGIENPRLLLLSRGKGRLGLGNEHDLVGRFFMEHVGLQSGFISSPAMLARPDLHQHRSDGDTRIRPVVRLDESVTRQEELLSVAFLLDPMPSEFAGDGFRSLTTLRRVFDHRPRPPDLLGHAVSVVRNGRAVTRAVLQLKGPARYARRGLSSRPPVVLLRVQAEQAPNPESRIVLGQRRDAFDLPLPRLDWRTCELDLRSIRRTQDFMDDEFRLAHLGSVQDKLGAERPPAVIYGLCHHIGTTRIHTDRKQGVVDPDCKLHGVKNLYLAGSSVFPTSGWANPTLTIVALAVRLADHLKNVLGAP